MLPSCTHKRCPSYQLRFPGWTWWPLISYRNERQHWALRYSYSWQDFNIFNRPDSDRSLNRIRQMTRVCTPNASCFWWSVWPSWQDQQMLHRISKRSGRAQCIWSSLDNMINSPDRDDVRNLSFCDAIWLKRQVQSQCPRKRGGWGWSGTIWRCWVSPRLYLVLGWKWWTDIAPSSSVVPPCFSFIWCWRRRVSSKKKWSCWSAEMFDIRIDIRPIYRVLCTPYAQLWHMNRSRLVGTSDETIQRPRFSVNSLSTVPRSYSYSYMVYRVSW